MGHEGGSGDGVKERRKAGEGRKGFRLKKEKEEREGGMKGGRMEEKVV